MKLQTISENTDFFIKGDTNGTHEQNSKFNFRERFRQKMNVVIKIFDVETQKNEICFMKIDDFIDSGQILKYKASYVTVLLFFELQTKM